MLRRLWRGWWLLLLLLRRRRGRAGLLGVRRDGDRILLLLPTVGEAADEPRWEAA